MKAARVTLMTILLVLAAAQLVPVDRSNPPVTGEIAAPPAVMSILRRSCYDCHSNQTRWPWYSRVAPVSWMVANDVKQGRKHLNLSRWSELPPAKQRKAMEEMWEEVEERQMPLGIYLTLHGEAKLTRADKEVLREWADGRARPDPTASSARPDAVRGLMPPT